MLNANYTSENIARALGLGGFANDELLGPAPQALRVLLTPSFTPEVCISFLRCERDVRIHVVAARFQIWHQVGPAPSPALTDRAEGACALSQLDELLSLLRTAADPGDVPRSVTINGGVKVHSVLRQGGRGMINLREDDSSTQAHLAYVDRATMLAWQCIAEPRVRNALRPDLRPAHEPKDKPVVQTMVLGGQQEKGALLAALKRQHGS